MRRRLRAANDNSGPQPFPSLVVWAWRNDKPACFVTVILSFGIVLLMAGCVAGMGVR